MSAASALTNPVFLHTGLSLPSAQLSSSFYYTCLVTLAESSITPHSVSIWVLGSFLARRYLERFSFFQVLDVSLVPQVPRRTPLKSGGSPFDTFFTALLTTAPRSVSRRLSRPFLVS